MLTTTRIEDVRVTADEAEALAAFCRDVVADPYTSDSAHLDDELRGRLADVAPRLVEEATRFGDRCGSSGVLRFRGLPIPADLPPTPVVSYEEVCRPTGTEPLVIGLGLAAGDVLAFEGWRNGHRVHNVYPLVVDADGQKASNSVRLAMHNEAAFRPDCPEALAILYLKDGLVPAPSTAFCDLHAVWDALPARDRARLEEPAFCFVGRNEDGQEELSDSWPVAFPWRDGLRFQFVPAIYGTTPFHEQALRRFTDGIAAATFDVKMVPGDLVFIDNVHVVHGRTLFRPRCDGTDRWLQRCQIRGRG